MNNPVLYYVFDPMCSWCYAYQPIYQRVMNGLNNHPITHKNILGGLAADSDLPMPLTQQKQIKAIWQRIEEETGTPFNYNFWRECEPRRSTYAACRAVIAARKQQAEQAMLEAIQEAYYLRAMNPSEDDTLLQLADEMGLQFDQFEQDFYKAETEKTLQDNIALAHSMPIDGFPSWVLEYEQRYYRIIVDYHSHLTTLAGLGDVMKNLR